MDLRQRLESVSPASWARPLLFWALALLYLRWAIDPRVLFDAFGFIIPVPTPGAALLEFPGHPGDFARGLGVVASEMYQSPWWGARNIAGTAFGLWLGTRVLMRLASGSGPGLAAYLPPVLLLAAFTAFEHPLARYDDYQGPQTSSLALALGLWHAVLYAAAGALFGPRIRLAAVPLLCFSAHWLAGGAVLVLAALAALVEAAARRWLAAAVCLAAGAALPWALTLHLYDLIPGDGMTRLLPLSYWTRPGAYGFATAMWLSVPAAVAVAVVWSRLGAAVGEGTGLAAGWAARVRTFLRPAGGVAESRFGGEGAKAVRKDREQAEGGSGSIARGWLPPPIRAVVRMTAPVLLAGAGIALSWDGPRRDFFEAAHYSRREMWPELLDMVRHRPGAFEHPFLHREALRGLYHTGRLGDDLFSLPVSAAAAPVPWLSLPRDRDPQLWDHAQIAGLALDLGDLNRAEHFHHELLEGAGEHPAVLRQLALVNLAKGRPETAGVFLNALGPARRGDPEAVEERVRYLQSVMFLDDDVSFIEDAPPRAESTATLEALLERNPANRMAFEYLMTRYLISGRAGEVSRNMWRLSGLGYRRIPRHYEETIVVHEFTTGERVEVPGLRVSDETRQRFEAFKTAARSLRSDQPEARERLAPEFGDGFFYYRTFGRTGA